MDCVFNCHHVVVRRTNLQQETETFFFLFFKILVGKVRRTNLQQETETVFVMSAKLNFAAVRRTNLQQETETDSIIAIAITNPALEEPISNRRRKLGGTEAMKNPIVVRRTNLQQETETEPYSHFPKSIKS